jgi:hypothetical protein
LRNNLELLDAIEELAFDASALLRSSRPRRWDKATNRKPGEPRVTVQESRLMIQQIAAEFEGAPTWLGSCFIKLLLYLRYILSEDELGSLAEDLDKVENDGKVGPWVKSLCIGLDSVN